MAEDEVFVDGSELISVERCRERVRHLFGVTCETAFIALGSNEPSRIRLHSSDADAQENIEKATRYLESVVGNSQRVVCKELRVSQQHFEMVQEHHDTIEKQFQVFLDLQKPCTVKLRSNHDRINQAEEFVSRLFSTKSSHDGCELETLNSSTSDYFTDGSLLSPSVSDFVQSDEGIGKKDSLSSLQGSSARLEHLKARGSAQEMSRSPMSFLQDERGSSESYGSGSLSSRSDTPDLDIDISKLTSTPEYTAKLEKAMKLGYSEDQLVQTLQKLGFDADQNQVLSEMIKLGSSAKVSQEEAKRAGDRLESFEDEASVEQRKEIIDDSSNLRHIVIDGSNVAMSHGKEVFSCQGIKIAVDWFRERGHENVTVFVPQWRKETSRPDAPITDQEILTQLEKEGVLSFTPARRVGGRRMVCYDDRYILNLAAEEDGIVVSNDNYRDLLNEKEEFKKVVEERLLMYTFVSNRFMPPDDPLGRRGPSLDNFLRKEHTIPEPLPPKCPYEKKCTYGNKCRYYHPERKNRPHQSITDKLQEQAKQKWQERALRPSDSGSFDKKRIKEPVKNPIKKPLARTSSIFPSGLPDELIAPREESAEKTLKEEYNEKLNEARKKLERAQFNRKAYFPEDELVHAASRQTPSYDFTPSQQENQLKVPHSQPKEGLVSGHLLLAKKLSDEAQDSSFFRSEGSVSSDEMCRSSPQSFSYPSSPCRPVSHLSSGIADIQYYPGLEPVHRPVSASRDRSPRHMPQDRGVCHSVPSMLMRPDTSMSLDYGPQYRSFPLPNSEYHTKPEQLMYPGQDDYYEHSAVNRYPSAPGASHLRQVSSMPQMQRQNSTSDPQLHMVGDNELQGRSSGQGYQRQALQHQLNPHRQSNESYGQGQGYGYQSWGESDMYSNAGLRPIQKSFPSGPSGQFPPAGQERAMSADFGRSTTWGGQMSPISPHQPYNQTPRMSSLPYQQQIPQQISQQIPQQMPQQMSHQMPQMSSQPISYQGYAPDAPIEPTDPRYTMYYHLCNLFPKTKVLAVMNQHPTETDPKVLCNYIIRFGERI